MNTNTIIENNLLDDNENNLSNSNNLFYIDNTNNLSKDYNIIKVNYKKYHSLNYKEVINYIDKFHTLFLNKHANSKKNPKIIILIDVKILKNTINVNHSSMYNINLINVIKHVNNNFNDHIHKCITINCNDVEKGLILFFKTIFKNIQFVNKIKVCKIVNK